MINFKLLKSGRKFDFFILNDLLSGKPENNSNNIILAEDYYKAYKEQKTRPRLECLEYHVLFIDLISRIERSKYCCLQN